MAVPVQVARLIETFERNIESYRQGRYNEAQVRKEFIDPFFKALGWDVDKSTYPWVAYKGERFSPEFIVNIFTPAYTPQ